MGNKSYLDSIKKS
uniref:Uncharacterized protein n=1 Tax=Lepeophtheirus salmonis TaxID=72036 RepID=A0A0K2TZT2_LEPSM